MCTLLYTVCRVSCITDCVWCAAYFLCILAGVIGGANLAGYAITAGTRTHKVTDLTGAGAFVLSAAACAW